MDSTIVNGLGAWSFYYKKDMVVDTDRKKAGIIAMKQELILNGYNRGITLTPIWGNYVQAETLRFQKDNSLMADGVLGPTTARYLFRYRLSQAKNVYSIPNTYLAHVLSNESAFDPVAQGYETPQDEGIGQIDLTDHPTVTQAQAWNPNFAVPWSAEYLEAAKAQVGTWQGAIVNYNVGESLAKEWQTAGFPASGGPLIKVGNLEVDAWTHCTDYWNKVLNSAV